MTLRSLQALCLTSFFIADVRDGLGPFLGIFLTQHHWQPDDIGLLMTAGMAWQDCWRRCPQGSSPTLRRTSV
jgi:hypothetical protein